LRGDETVSGLTEFGTDYAKAYDAIYRSKDYDGEVNLIERILAMYGLAGGRRLLDLGCGTGNHVFRLAERGHFVVGVDRSSEMLALARTKAIAGCAGLVEFHEADIRKLDLGQWFDAVLMMFTVLGYQLDDGELMTALATVRRHLATDGLFLFDVWHGPAVLAKHPGERQVSVKQGAARITRKTRANLDVPRHLCSVTFDLERIDNDDRVKQWQENHVVRYYFYDELKSALAQNRLELFCFRSFPDFDAPADERAWNVIGVARAR
jgi:SAM-dependent methyltransferase